MKTNVFELRHIGPRPKDVQDMLEVVKANSLDELIDQTIPSNIKLHKPFDLDEPISEFDFLQHIQELGEKNKIFKSYIGLGYHP